MKFILLNIFLISLVLSCKSNNEKNPEDDPAITEASSAIVKEVRGFYFVGMYSRIPSIYYYDIKEDKIKLIKSNKAEKIYELEVAPDGNAFFYLTYKELNRKIAIPEINGIKIFRFEPAVEKSELLQTLKPAIQLYSYWMDNDRYRVVAISFDEIVASYLNKNALTFNYFGKLLSDENELFDLVKNGYPVVELPALSNISPMRRFEIISRSDTLFVRNNYDGTDKKLNLIKKNLIRIVWADNLKNVVFMMKNNSTDKTDLSHTLILYDLLKKKIVKTFEEKGIKSLMLLGDYLIYDYKTTQHSAINIFKLSSLETIKTLSLEDGCALKSLPLK
uniref:Lipoprotein n=1 Tax=Ignavibacterium album TaxID=591197 RepID=A0A7V2ZHA2_9BACT